MLNRMLTGARTIALGGHIRPDGDCVGSCIGLYQYIKENYSGKKVTLYLEEIPEPFRCLKGTDEICHQIPEGERVDLFICMDCGDENRLGFALPLFENAERTFCIDHHISNQSFAKENYIDPDASSTSELVYGLLDPDRISKESAEALYLGIVHDTGVFQYSSTHPSTLMTAAELLKKGIDAPGLIRKTFYEKTYEQNQILGRALVESLLFLEGLCVVSYLRRQELEFYGVTPKELDGIVNHLRNTKGTEVAVFMYELERDLYKVSLRSGNEIDVSRIAQYFGGGGHRKAAGLTMSGTAHEVIRALLEQIGLQAGRRVE